MSESTWDGGRGSAIRGLIFTALLLATGAPLWAAVVICVFFCGPFAIHKTIRWSRALGEKP